MIYWAADPKLFSMIKMLIGKMESLFTIIFISRREQLRRIGEGNWKEYTPGDNYSARAFVDNIPYKHSLCWCKAADRRNGYAMYTLD